MFKKHKKISAILFVLTVTVLTSAPIITILVAGSPWGTD